MIERIVDFAVRRSWTVVAVTLLAATLGIGALLRLPIDAVPDITNVQVQINLTAPSLAPHEIERQITFPVETALAGIPGLASTRSLTRHGFAQVTAVFDDATDIYFARSQVAERLRAAEAGLPAGVDAAMGPIATGLGDVFMWTVEYSQAPSSSDETGLQADGSYRTPEGDVLRTDAERATYLRTVQDWIVAPQLKTLPNLAGVDVIGGYVKQYLVAPDPQRLAAAGLGLPFPPTAERSAST